MIKPLLMTLALCLPLAAWAETRGAALARVDGVADDIAQAVEEVALAPVVAIDHARLAEETGKIMPPARVALFNDATLATAILSQDIRAGLDLPMRVLAYDQDGTTQVVYTDAAFLKARHGLAVSDALRDLDGVLNGLLDGLDVLVMPAPVADLTPDYGVLSLTSDHDFATTIERLRAAVMSQGDTVWFGDVDFTADAAVLGQTLPPATLLLFGGPAPGGVAMAGFPAIGLDAFCQKLLVYQDADGAVQVLYNDIAALAELHYGTSAKPHAALNQRLAATFAGAVAQ